MAIVGEQDRRILVTQVEHKELPEGRSGQDDRLFKHPRRLEPARGHIQAYAAPARSRQVFDFSEQLGRSPAQRDEGDTQGLQSRQMRIGGQARIEDEVAGILPVMFLPEGDEAEDLLGFIALAQIGVGVAEGATGRILGEERQDARLARLRIET